MQLDKYRVLVVDDDRDMVTLLCTWLAEAGFDAVDSAPSGADALQRIDITRPNLVVTDLVMRDMDGMTLLTEIHRNNPLMPVIMLSGQAQVRDAVKAMHLGISEFLINRSNGPSWSIVSARPCASPRAPRRHKDPGSARGSSIGAPRWPR